MSTKPTPEQMGKNLEDFAADAKLEEEADRLGTRKKGEVAESLALSEEDRERARALGQRAAEAFAKRKAEAKPLLPPPQIAPAPSRKIARWAVPLGIAATFAMVLAMEREALLAWIQNLGPTTVGSARDAGGDRAEANELRGRAREDYRQGRFEDCLKKLDAAKALDPEGEANAEITAMRSHAAAELARDAAARGAE
jgi:hypothetical protein